MFSNRLRVYMKNCISFSSPLAVARPLSANRLESIRTKSDGGSHGNEWFSNKRVKLGVLAGTVSLIPLYFVIKTYNSKNEPSSSTSSSLPDFIPYVLIGGGTASYYAALTIRARDATAKVLIIGDEEETPYNRPALSKELWWYGDENAPTTLEYISPSGRKRDVRYEVEGWYIAPNLIDKQEHGAVSFARGRKVQKIDLQKNEIILDNDKRIKFNKCLIATGGRPTTLSVFDNLLRFDKGWSKFVTYFQKIGDYQKLDSIARKAKSIAVVGDGFLSSELAYSSRKRYAKNGLQVHQIMSEPGNFSEFLPEFLREHIKSELQDIGIQIHTNCSIQSAGLLPNGRVELTLNDKDSTKLEVDHVVVDVGIEPNVEIAIKSGLTLDRECGGILSDAGMKINPDIYCAGDVCSFDDITLGRRRLEQWEHAQISGRVAGENMTGGNKKYTHQSSFYTILGPNVHFSGVGDVSSKYTTVSVFAPFKNDSDVLFRGVVFYLKEKRVVGVVLYNIFGFGIEMARKIIGDAQEHEDFTQLAKLFDVYYTPPPEEPKNEESVDTEENKESTDKTE